MSETKQPNYNSQDILSRIGLSEDELRIKNEVVASAKKLSKEIVSIYHERSGKVKLVISGASRKVAVDLFNVIITWSDEEDKAVLSEMLKNSVRLNPKQNSEMYSSGWQELGTTMADVIGDQESLLIFWEDHVGAGEKAERLVYRGSEEGREVKVIGFAGKKSDYGNEDILVGSGDPNLFRLLESISIFRSTEFRERAGLTNHRSISRGNWAKAVFKGLSSGKVSQTLTESWEDQS